ncbi:radial spokehead-like protein [Fimicolochytrium jonesii]|uniref:radial spokehead-like protein n=1 Tax=Fimicolochytrium jonesii TaxID=1396493 RepID=UPI0022FE7F64|nr:radial spokehead-like protein [Fimicolochytrium jonesii]KAI8819381.1 radial spokehead-like protein [Fimicolochytrium jonesii]
MEEEGAPAAPEQPTEPSAAPEDAAAAAPVEAEQAEPVRAAEAPATEPKDEVEPATPVEVHKAQPVQPAHPFLNRKDAYIKPDTQLPEDSELALAKAFLMSQSDKSNMNLYDHLTEVVMHILETRPNNVVDAFERISADIKRTHFHVDKPTAPGAFKKVHDVHPASEVEAAQVKLFERSSLDGGGDDAEGEIPDIMDLANLWEWAGVSFGKEEIFMLFLSLKRLVTEKPLASVRLWGKIFGTHANYIIIEAELKEGSEDEEEPVEEPGPEAEAGEDAQAGQDSENREGGEDGQVQYPKKKVKPVVPLPKETRAGVNKYVYYVCNFAGGAWSRLPDVIPEKLQASRRIRKLFTGDLKRQIVSYPPFNGTEAQYLRCQIARIAAATVVSPAGYYAFDQEEENEDEENASPSIIINPEYEAHSNEALLEISNWVHHTPYILPQGRVTWENPNPPKEENEDGNEDDEGSENGSGKDGDGEEEPEAEPETGPPILSPLTGDEEHDGMACWVSRMCSTLSSAKFSPILLRCTRWPGATVVSYNEKFANIYVGDGHKDQTRFVPPPLPELQKEYATGEGAAGNVEFITEQNDPSLAEETAFEEERRAREEEQQEESDDEGRGEEDGSDD